MLCLTDTSLCIYTMITHLQAHSSSYFIQNFRILAETNNQVISPADCWLIIPWPMSALAISSSHPTSLKVSATLYCNSDKASNYIAGEDILILLPSPPIQSLPLPQVQPPKRWRFQTPAAGTGWIHHHRRSLFGQVPQTGTTAVTRGPLETNHLQLPWFALDLYSGGFRLQNWLGYRLQ